MISHKIYEVITGGAYPDTKLHEVDSIPVDGAILPNDFQEEEQAEFFISYLAPEGRYTILKIYS